MRNSLTAFIIVSLLFITACGGTNHWDGLSSAESLVRNEVYVSKSGDDALGDGSPQMPYASITKGISDASTRGYGIVRVAEGLYSENISLIEGVSLYGGYDPSTWTRDIVSYAAEIDGGAGSAIIADGLVSPITRATVVDGFILLASGGVGVVVISNSSPSITNNVIDGFDFGVQCTNSSAIISNNTIFSGNTGIECNTGSDTISNNTINLTDIGINCTASSGAIRNNTITANNNGILCTTYSGTISGNTITSNVFGIQHVGTGGTMTYINGNTIVSQNRGINISAAGIATVSFNNVTALMFGIRSESSAVTISYNTVLCTTGATNYAIYINLGTVSVYGNILTGGSVGTSYGIYNDDADTVIYNNVITGGSGSNNSFGIYTTDVCLPEIYNNTINGGVASNISAGIDILDSSPRISNNIIYISAGGPTQRGIWEENGSSDPLEFRNNNIFNCTTALYRDEGAANITTEGGLAAVGTGNLSRDLTGLIDAQGRRTAPWPIEVIGDGLNGAVQAPPWVFNIDRDRTPRTTSAVAPLSWSMGAYEYDTL